MDISPDNEELVKTIAAAMKLKEGEEAVRRMLIQIFRAEKIGTKDLAISVRLPIPVTAAIRRELEKAGLVARRGGAILTKKGIDYVTGVLRVTRASEKTKQEYVEDSDLFKKFKLYASRRPPVNPELDQAYATPETALKRVSYMQHWGDLDGRRLLFLGDDDLTSIAAGILGNPREIMVIDIDERILNLIEETSKTEGLSIECIKHDLRFKLPERVLGRFDVFYTDPPYTVNGAKLFLSRGLQALRLKKTSNIYLAFADKPPLEMLSLHRALTKMGLYVSELQPRFNKYEGAEIFGNTTNQLRLTVTEKAKPSITEKYTGKLYTGEIHPKLRLYKCTCGKVIKVGPNQRYTSIANLKAEGCSHCGSCKGFKLNKRVNLPGLK